MIYKSGTCQELQCILRNLESFIVFVPSPDFPHGPDFVCHNQLFEAITVTKFGISGFSAASYIPSPPLFIA